MGLPTRSQNPKKPSAERRLESRMNLKFYSDRVSKLLKLT